MKLLIIPWVAEAQAVETEKAVPRIEKNWEILEVMALIYMFGRAKGEIPRGPRWRNLS